MDLRESSASLAGSSVARNVDLGFGKESEPAWLVRWDRRQDSAFGVLGPCGDSRGAAEDAEVEHLDSRVEHGTVAHQGSPEQPPPSRSSR